MNKALYFLSALFLLASCGSKLNPYFGHKAIGYKHKLSKATWRAYLTEEKNGEWVQGELDWIYIVTFDEQGNLIGAESYDSEGQLTSRTAHFYLEKQRVKMTSYDSSGSPLGTRIFDQTAPDRYDFKEEDKELLLGYVTFSNDYEADLRLIKEYSIKEGKDILEYESHTTSTARSKKYYDELENMIYLTKNEFLEFNQYGDWIKALRFDEYEDQRDAHIIIRVMEYK